MVDRGTITDQRHRIRTGFGAHGDYLFGWKDDALQQAMDNLGGKCASEDCTQVLDIQSGNDAIACTKAQQAEEDVGSSNCTCPFINICRTQWLTLIVGLKTLPGGMAVM